jgi:hypothetical protein
MTAEETCAGSGTWVGWGWRWWPCPVCGGRIDVDENTLELVDHPPVDLPVPSKDDPEKR